MTHWLAIGFNNRNFAKQFSEEKSGWTAETTEKATSRNRCKISDPVNVNTIAIIKALIQAELATPDMIEGLAYRLCRY